MVIMEMDANEIVKLRVMGRKANIHGCMIVIGWNLDNSKWWLLIIFWWLTD